jgi:hypothetical protein
MQLSNGTSIECKKSEYNIDLKPGEVLVKIIAPKKSTWYEHRVGEVYIGVPDDRFSYFRIYAIRNNLSSVDTYYGLDGDHAEVLCEG